MWPAVLWGVGRDRLTPIDAGVDATPHALGRTVTEGAGCPSQMPMDAIAKLSHQAAPKPAARNSAADIGREQFSRHRTGRRTAPATSPAG